MRQPEAPFVTTAKTNPPLLLYFVFKVLLQTAGPAVQLFWYNNHLHVLKSTSTLLQGTEGLISVKAKRFAKSRTAAVHASASNSY